MSKIDLYSCGGKENVSLDDFCSMDNFLDDTTRSSWKISDRLSLTFTICINLTNVIRSIHLRGYYFNNLTPQNIMIDSKTGDVAIINIDCGTYEEGMLHDDIIDYYYAAPEVIKGHAKIDVRSNYYVLAVILYRLIFGDHPMVGKKWENIPLLTDKIKWHLLGYKPIFHFSPFDKSNEVTMNYGRQAIENWKCCPIFLRRYFTNVFTKGVDNLAARPSDDEWIAALIKGRDCIIKLDREYFVDDNLLGSLPDACMKLYIGGKSIILAPKNIYAHSIFGQKNKFDDTVIASIHLNNAKQLMIVNLSDEEWSAIPHSNINDKLIIRKGDEVQICKDDTFCFKSKTQNITGVVKDFKDDTDLVLNANAIKSIRWTSYFHWGAHYNRGMIVFDAKSNKMLYESSTRFMFGLNLPQIKYINSIIKNINTKHTPILNDNEVRHLEILMLNGDTIECDDLEWVDTIEDYLDSLYGEYNCDVGHRVPVKTGEKRIERLYFVVNNERLSVVRYDIISDLYICAEDERIISFTVDEINNLLNITDDIQNNYDQYRGQAYVEIIYFDGKNKKIINIDDESLNVLEVFFADIFRRDKRNIIIKPLDDSFGEWS